MRDITKYLLTAGAAFGLLAGLTHTALSQDKGKDNPIKAAMQKYHKAPKGTDPTCKVAGEGKASKEDLEGMVKAYTAMASTKPPQGDDASWKEKTAKLLAATKDLHAGKAGAADAYKAAVNCKACHSVHRPQ